MTTYCYFGALKETRLLDYSQRMCKHTHPPCASKLASMVSQTQILKANITEVHILKSLT